METLTGYDAFVDQFGEIHCAEKPPFTATTMAKASSAPELREVFECDWKDLETHVESQENIAEQIGESSLGQNTPSPANLGSESRTVAMIRWTVLVGLLVQVSGVLGFGTMLGDFAYVARLLMLVFLVLFVVLLFAGGRFLASAIEMGCELRLMKSLLVLPLSSPCRSDHTMTPIDRCTGRQSDQACHDYGKV